MARDEDQEGDEGEAPKRASQFQLWLEEAWEGWLKSVGVIFLCAIAYVLYKFDLITESLAGLIVVALIILGSVASTWLHARHLAADRPPAQKALLAMTALLWIVGTGYPSLRAAMPPAPIAEGKLTSAQLTTKLSPGGTGPYELTVSGHFKAAGMAEAAAGYAITATGGGGEDRVDGELKRQAMRVRVSRKGGTSTSMVEQTELLHRLRHVTGPEVTLTADGIDDAQLEEGLTVALRPGGLNPMIFWILGGLAFLLALGFDARLTDQKGKEKSYLAAACGVCVVFSIFFPDLATPHSLVRPAVDALLRGLFLGGILGWLLGVVGRVLFGPKIKKAKR